MRAGTEGRLTIEQINQLDRDDFVDALGWVCEDSPWVAARAWEARPFADRASLHAAMAHQVRAATRDEQLALLLAHPDLGTRTRMSAASAGEQAGAGLGGLSVEEQARLQAANAAYRHRFGFPFLFAVRGSTPRHILTALEARLTSTAGQEFETALQQVLRIAGFRLEDLVAR